MDRADLVHRLSQAHNLVYMGADRVRRQRNRLARLKRKGNQSARLQATALLASLEATLARHIEERKRFAQELVDFDREQPRPTPWARMTAIDVPPR